MKLEVESAMRESESRMEVRVLDAAVWIEGAEPRLCLTPCQLDRPP